MEYLPAETYAIVEQSVPLACVDFIPTRMVSERRQIGLILRESPYGRVWCHLGGRIGRGETIGSALQRHARDTLGCSLILGDDPQPDHVYQWFPPEALPAEAVAFAHGDDKRKHAIGLSFVLALEGEPQPRNEALDFGWFDHSALPEDLWPGCEALFERLLRVR